MQFRFYRSNAMIFAKNNSDYQNLLLFFMEKHEKLVINAILGFLDQNSMNLHHFYAVD